MVAAHPTERHEARPEHIGLAQHSHLAENHALTKPGDNHVHHQYAAAARNDMQELSSKHGFPHNDILKGHEHGHPGARGQHPSESSRVADATPAKTETARTTESSSEVVGYHHVASVMGNDSATVANKQTEVSTDTKFAATSPSDTAVANQPASFEPPVSTVEPGRPSAPIASLQTPYPARNEMG